ncbi:protein kinase domain protein [Ichthyophthirius multifiliis]|uniref:non-specific serine/threonine protein kinase n=1 Tax=Ichthyophthirius multifiliis TaxID=5932 RepID=G0R3F5_ICHMU|nr:protein kinase domain protein [Ichthyophthirius multifiliis]EGR28006.1 protein kinase domain protein [Ichthyophthirius multifiliis]|eukprot:XP_004027351.1 protein kinase domain protein [Ichthyophthirius multifiliis]
MQNILEQKCQKKKKNQKKKKKDKNSIIESFYGSILDEGSQIKNQQIPIFPSKPIQINPEKQVQNLNKTFQIYNSDIKFQIKNKDTGINYLFEQKNKKLRINIRYPLIQRKKEEEKKYTTTAWVDWWQKKRQINQQFLENSKQNNIEKCLQLLDKKLADQKAEINTKDSLNGWTALHYSAYNNNLNLISHLLFHEAIIDSLSLQNQTPLMLSTIKQNIDIVQILITAGADINIQDFQQNTAFHYSCIAGNQKLIQIFLKKASLNYNLVNNEGKKALDLCENKNIKQDFFSYMNFQSENQQKVKIIETQKKLNQIFQKGNIQNLQKKISVIQIQIQIQIYIYIYIYIYILYNQKIQSISTHSNFSEEKIDINTFNIFGMIGKGSFGEVFLVEKRDNMQLYAMKVLQKSKILNNNLTKYALTERNILSSIKHPFIVKLVYAFQNTDKLFLILNYCPGGDLGELLQKEKQLSEQQVLNYSAEIVLALEHLHSKDIIFRDLKPDNIVLDHQGHALLTDFGLSKEGVLENATGAKSFCGSIAYLAPEMLKKCGHGKAVDWYLLGVVIYELLVGIPPYYSHNKDELFYNIQNAQLKLPDFLSMESRSLLKSLLQRNPIKRLGSGKGDAEEIKAHPFFKKINWKDVEQRFIFLN